MLAPSTYLLCVQDMHLLAERQILAALNEGGWVQGDVDDMMEHRLCALFMPHGEARSGTSQSSSRGV